MSLTSNLKILENKIVKSYNFNDLKFLKKENLIAVYKTLSLEERWGVKECLLNDNNDLKIILELYQGNDLNKIKINKIILKKIFKIIQSFQKIKPQENQIKEWDYKTFHQYFLKKNENNQFKNKLISEIKKLNKIFLNKDEKKEIKYLSHNDLHKGNFIEIKKNIKLIDFDFVSLNFKLADCASIIHEFELKNDLKKYWIELWSLDEKEKVFLNYLIKYQIMVWYLWADYFYLKTKKTEYKEIALLKKKQIEEI